MLEVKDQGGSRKQLSKREEEWKTGECGSTASNEG